MEAGLDTGPILAEAKTAIGNETASELTEKLAQIGADLLVHYLDLVSLESVTLRGKVQPVHLIEPVYAKKIAKVETRLDFSQSADQVERQVRAFAPAAWFELDGERFRVLVADVVGSSGTPGTTIDDRLTIACASGAIHPTLVQRAGRPAMPTADLLRGRPIPAGTRLS
jgi:methionyl-tRNA formyltransferase